MRKTHALLWNGTAASAVDLNPSGFKSSFAYGTNGTQQVGNGQSNAAGNSAHALLWTGTAQSAVDLQALLPSSGDWTSSFAFTIDSTGDVFGYANGTYNGVTGAFAVEWSSAATTSVPLPPAVWTGAATFLLATIAAAKFRRPASRSLS